MPLHKLPWTVNETIIPGCVSLRCRLAGLLLILLLEFELWIVGIYKNQGCKIVKSTQQNQQWVGINSKFVMNVVDFSIYSVDYNVIRQWPPWIRCKFRSSYACNVTILTANVFDFSYVEWSIIVGTCDKLLGALLCRTSHFGILALGQFCQYIEILFYAWSEPKNFTSQYNDA